MRKISILIIVIIATVFAGFILYTQVIRPNQQYLMAEDAMNEGNYDIASDIFISLGKYKDAEEMVKESRYQKGIILMNSGDYDEADLIFDDLVDNSQYQDSYKNAEEYQDENKYRKALSLYNSGQYLAAADIFTRLRIHDSWTMEKDCNYMEIHRLIDVGEFDNALETIRKNSSLLNGYKDSGDLEDKCYYKKGLSFMNSGDYDEAIDAFKMAHGYMDASILKDECRYLKADLLYKQGNYEAAYRQYINIPEYKNVDDIITNDQNILNAAWYMKLDELNPDISSHESSNVLHDFNWQIAHFNKPSILDIFDCAYFSQSDPLTEYETARAFASMNGMEREFNDIQENTVAYHNGNSGKYIKYTYALTSEAAKTAKLRPEVLAVIADSDAECADPAAFWDDNEFSDIFYGFSYITKPTSPRPGYFTVVVMSGTEYEPESPDWSLSEEGVTYVRSMTSKVVMQFESILSKYGIVFTANPNVASFILEVKFKYEADSKYTDNYQGYNAILEFKVIDTSTGERVGNITAIGTRKLEQYVFLREKDSSTSTFGTYNYIRSTNCVWAEMPSITEALFYNILMDALIACLT